LSLPGCHGGNDDITPAGLEVGSAQDGLLGDLNGSGTPDVADAVGILRIVVGLDADDPLADSDQNGSTGVADAILVLRCLVGLEQWPIGSVGLVLYSISAESGRPGDEIVLSGSGFKAEGSLTQVLFGGSQAPILELAGTSIRVLVPFVGTIYGGSRNVTVHVGGESTRSIPFTVNALAEPVLSYDGLASCVETNCLRTSAFTLQALQQMAWVDAGDAPDIAAVDSEINAIFGKIAQEINGLQSDEIELLEALLQEYAVIDILEQLGAISDTGDVGVIISGAGAPAPAQSANYATHYIYWKLDTLCGLMADVHRVLGVVKLVAAATGIGLPIAAIVHAIDVGVNLIAEIINMVIPTDLEALQMSSFGLLVGDSHSPPVTGTFAPQRDFVTGTVRVTVALLMPIWEDATGISDEIITRVCNMLADIGLHELSIWSTSRLQGLRRSLDTQVPVDMSLYRVTAVDLVLVALLQSASPFWDGHALNNDLERAGVPVGAITLFDPISVSPTGRVNFSLADFIFAGIGAGDADVELNAYRWKPTSLFSWGLGFTLPQSLPAESRGHATITVTGPAAPTVNLTADATSITRGQSTTLRWTSTNATFVVSSNFGAPEDSVTGSQLVTPTATTTYTITVGGPGGQATSSVTVTVTGGGGDPGDETTGPDGQTLVWVPGGSFMMGSTEGYIDQQPVHQVTLDGFWLGKCEVTNDRYAAFLTMAQPADVSQWLDVSSEYCQIEQVGASYQAKAQLGQYPVVTVTWHGATAYCAQHGYSLPTEAQWEYAAAGPDSRRYPWGAEWDQWKCCNSQNLGPYGMTFPVGSFVSGAAWCRALDMTGNVWEWCADWYLSTYYGVSPELNPPGPANGAYRVHRSASYLNGGDVCRVATRSNDSPASASRYYGFRVTRSGQ
jgi:formylglycine-generating enzyme required for sulfatase activity